MTFSYQSNVARDILDTILNIQPKDSSGGGETRESVVYRMSEDMLSKLPPNYVVFEVFSCSITFATLFSRLSLLFIYLCCNLECTRSTL